MSFLFFIRWHHLPMAPWINITKYVWFLGYQKIQTGFYNGGLWENLFGRIKKNEYICLKNNIVHLYLILGRADLHWKFLSTPFWRMAVILTDFPTGSRSVPCAALEIWEYQASLNKLEYFQCRSALPNIKYKRTILFLRQMYWLFFYTIWLRNRTYSHWFKLLVDFAVSFA